LKKTENPPARKHKPFHNNKLISNPFKPYTKEELDLIVKLLNDNKSIHVNEILNKIKEINPESKLTNTQIKKVRFVYLKGDEIAKSQLYDFTENDKSKWFTSRIKIQLNKRKKGQCNFDEEGNTIL